PRCGLPQPPLGSPLHPRPHREPRRGRAALDAWQLLLAFLASFAAGYLGSAVGLVLGTLRLPAILLLSGDAAAGAGTNIGISAGSGAAGGHPPAPARPGGWRVVAWMGPPSVVGAVAGALLTDELPTRLLLALIAAILAWNGFFFLLGAVLTPHSRKRVRH